MRTILATLAAFALFAADEAPAPKLDRIILTNGRALAGTIESEADDHYMIKLAAGGGGALLIKKDRVESVVRGVEEMPKPTDPAVSTGAEIKPPTSPKTGHGKPAPPTVGDLNKELATSVYAAAVSAVSKAPKMEVGSDSETVAQARDREERNRKWNSHRMLERMLPALKWGADPKSGYDTSQAERAMRYLREIEDQEKASAKH